MKKLFRKAATVLGSAGLIGMTVGMAAAAASYPDPFTSNTVIVTGINAAPSDNIAAASIAANLDAASASTLGTVGGSITGGSADLSSGGDQLYLNDEFDENVQILTKSDMPVVLADGTFTDDDGTNYDFEQILTIGNSTNNGFEFANSDNDLDDPALVLKLSTTSTVASAIYDLTATFNTAVPFNATDSEGEDLTLFGKTYTVGTATDADTLVLLGGAGSAIINVGEAQNIMVSGTSYSVTLDGLSSAATTQASITINGDTKTFTQGQTKTVGGIDAYVKTVFRTGDSGEGYAEVQLGADKLTLATGNAVQVGSDSDDIEGTLVTIVGGVNAMTELKFTISAEDNDFNHLLVGDSFVDPVFGSIVVKFDGVENGPVFSGEKDTGRTTMEITKGGNRELQLDVTDNAGDSATLPFTYEGVLSDDNAHTISVVEGASIADDGYFILNSGNNQHFMQITKMNTDAGSASDVAMKDLISGETYTFDNHNFVSGYTATISGQSYKITNDSATTVTVVSNDYGTGLADGNAVDVFPMIELVSGEDTRFAMTDDVVALDEFITGAAKTVTLNLPTGTIDVVANATEDAVIIGGELIPLAGSASIAAGDVYYNFAVANGGAENATDITVAIDSTPEADGGTAEADPGILFVEDTDSSETVTTTKPAIFMPTIDNVASSGYSSVSTPLFTGTMDTETWDDTDLTGWLSNYGTYVWRDTGDTNQNFVGLSYGDAMMYASVTFGEGEVSTTADAGVMTVKDSEVATVAGKNLIVIGGSAINSVAAELLGGAYSEAMFTSTTGVGAGEFLIESFSRAGKTALLVAGYNAADTQKAATYLLNNDVDTTVGMKMKGTSATEATVVTA